MSEQAHHSSNASIELRTGLHLAATRECPQVDDRSAVTWSIGVRSMLDFHAFFKDVDRFPTLDSLVKCIPTRRFARRAQATLEYLAKLARLSSSFAHRTRQCAACALVCILHYS
jgi:hypothetical protein